jgi:hypothetical protein
MDIKFLKKLSVVEMDNSLDKPIEAELASMYLLPCFCADLQQKNGT